LKTKYLQPNKSLPKAYLPLEDTIKIVPLRVAAMVSEPNNLVRKNFKLVPVTQRLHQFISCARIR
jgi:hypothetical protein